MKKSGCQSVLQKPRWKALPDKGQGKSFKGPMQSEQVWVDGDLTPGAGGRWRLSIAGLEGGTTGAYSLQASVSCR